MRLGGYGQFSFVAVSSGEAVKFRQGPSGSVELRRVGARRLCYVLLRQVMFRFGLAVVVGVFRYGLLGRGESRRFRSGWLSFVMVRRLW